MATTGQGGGSGVLNGKLYVYAVCRADGGFQSGLYIYDPATNSWKVETYVRTVRFPAMAAVNGKLYLVSGLEGGEATPLAVVYDPFKHVWSGIPPMSVQRYAATAVGMNGLLYVIGGYTSRGTPVATVEVYNPTTNTWRTVTDMPGARWWLGSGTVNGRIYAVGGHGATTLATNQAYVP